MRRLAVIVVLVLAVAACGGDDDDDVAAGGVDETTTTAGQPDASVSTTTTMTAGVGEVGALEVYAADILRWSDAMIEPGGGDHQFVIASPSRGDATVTTVGDDTDGWQVEQLFTDLPTGDEASASVKLGYPGENEVVMGFRRDDLTPDLAVAYGEGFANVVVVGGETGGEAAWSPALDPTLDTGPRRITVMWRDADGVAVAGWVTTVPAGEFAAG